ncbi:uncharacterized protein DUF2478 [Breoghania corrubedonensis]|uniref:Uncharacterized protein DUF2478 n=1 Tax=Breoghania corrubedonensis TaxID=665038 RepID=A0A2T5V7S0_9HYPH|nr:DUF2478 domain-containing protein [Breoghania corrubedonensis]PTW59799.1 uncharacterized protein DUF2478 [Breoghania corrubedonensis]
MTSDFEAPDPARTLAAIAFDPREDVDTLLGEAAAALSGCHIAGVVQIGGREDGCEVKAMALKSLRDGWEIRILEERGAQARGCRLSPHAITEVAGRLEAELAAGADILFVNRFGRSESEGYGLRRVFERAVLDGVPVLTAVRSDYRDAWNEFHGGLGTTLPRDREAVIAWCKAACAARAETAA